MTDVFGALQIPVQSAPGAQPVTDSLLGHVLSYTKAVMTADLGAAWAAVSRECLVKGVFPHDPEKHDFSSKDLPCLYAYRDEATPTQLSDNVIRDTCPINIIWVFPPSRQFVAAVQAPFFNGLGKVLRRAFEYGRHPAWHVPGDPDPYAATRGSLIWKYAGASNAVFRSATPDAVKIDAYDNKGAQIATYDALMFQLDVEETLSRSPDDYPGSAPTAGTTDIKQPDGSTQTILRAIENPQEA